MAISYVEAIIYTCDNPSCGKGFTVLEGDIPPGYYSEELTVRQSSHIVKEDFYACKKSCVGPALRAKVDKQGQADAASRSTAEPLPLPDGPAF